MTSNRSPTVEELNDVKQDTIQWPAKAIRSTLVDSDGGEITDSNSLPINSIANKNSNWLLEVGKGNIPGYSFIFNSGENFSVGGTGETIRSLGGRYSFPSSAEIRSVVSSSVNDTSAGTGARTVFIIGLDDTYTEQSEILILNGTTPVSTALSYLRINSFVVLTAGSLNLNEGNIDFLDGANNLGRIDIGEGQMRQTVATVPLGFTWFPTLFSLTSGRDDELRIDTIGISPARVQTVFSKQLMFQNNINFLNQGRFGFPETFDFEVIAVKTGSAPNANISLVQDFIQVQNSEF